MSDDGRWIGFRGTVNDRYKRNVTEAGIYADAYVIEAASGKITRLTENAEVGESSVSFSPDGSMLAISAPNDWSYFRDQKLWVKPTANLAAPWKKLGGQFDGLAWASFQYFRNWKEKVGGDCGLTRTGFLYITHPEYIESLIANIAMHQRIGIPSLLVRAEDVQRLAPSFAVHDFEFAAYEPESGYADPSAATNTFIEAARLRGAQLLQDCTVTEILVAGGRVSAVKTTQGDFSAPLVINAAGACASNVARLAGLEIPVDTWRHDTLFIKRPAEMGLSHPTVIDDANSMYFRPESGGLTLVGLEDQNPLGESPEGYTDRSQPGFVERAIERIMVLFTTWSPGKAPG